MSAHRDAPRAGAVTAIRRATAADLDAIDEIERHSFPAPWPRGVFVAELTRTWARVDVAHAGRDVIGFHDWWLVAGEVHVLAIAVHPDHRRRGIAAELLASALGEGRAAGATTATLEVRCGNAPAIALYERFGFRTVHVRARYYHDGVDALVMSATLT